MKAIVLENKNGKAAVLREDGVVLKIRGTYTVGETIKVKGKPQFQFAQPQFRTVFAAAVVVLALLFGGFYNYTTVQAAGYVTEEHVGIELVLNRQNKVIEIRSTDESGERIKEQLDQKQIVGLTLDDALTAVTDVVREDMQMQNPDAELQEPVFHASSSDHTLQEKMDQDLQKHQESSAPQNETVPAVQEAESLPEQPQEPAPDIPESNEVQPAQSPDAHTESSIQQEMNPPEEPPEEPVQTSLPQEKPAQQNNDTPAASAQPGIPLEASNQQNSKPAIPSEQHVQEQSDIPDAPESRQEYPIN